jgi:Ca-activated chloride channel family protein
MSFSHSWIFLIIPLYLAFEGILFFRVKTSSLSLATIPFIKASSTWRIEAVRWMRFAPVAMVVLLLMSLTKPESQVVREEILPSGVKIILGLDISGSMAAEDFHPENRLVVAKKVLEDFVSGRPSDQIGIILFAGRAITRSPLSLDHEALLRTLRSISLGMLPEGTAIGTAIISAVNRLQRTSGETEGAKKGDRILVLITDGRNNAGEIHPLDALEIAIRQKLKIYTIGVGTYGSVPFPVIDEKGKKTYRYEQADLDETLLREIARKTSGKYFRAGDADSLKRLFEQINQLEKSEPSTVKTTTIEDRSLYFAVPALFLGAAYFLFTIIIVRFP